MNKQQVEEILEEIATLLELKGENPFKSRAYVNAARTIGSLDADLAEAVKTGELRKMKGIGEAIFGKISELVTTGKLAYYDELKTSVPAGLIEMLRIPGLGAKRAKTIYDKLGVSTVGELEYACNENRLVALDGFGPKMQQKILDGIQAIKRFRGRFLYPAAFSEAEIIFEALKKLKTVNRISIAGSLRRRKETVKDIDFVVSTKNPAAVMTVFTALPGVEEVIAHGETKSSIRLASGIQADLRAVTDAEYPFALHHFTGSKEHNIAMRGRALKMGFKMNEYGLFKGEKLLPCRDEEAIFRRVGLDFIPPELREDMGEIPAAEEKRIPDLIESGDIRGIFHNHTTASDGNATLEEMVRAARDAGYGYIGISDHSRSAHYANGLSVERVREQHREIDSLQKRFRNITIFKGVECDILPDGTLDYPDDVLATFDFVIASVHSKFQMSEAEMTGRVIRAIRNPHVTMLGHATGRLLLSRDGYPIDMRKVIDAAGESGAMIELNAHPYRLDLDWRLGPYAKEKGVSISINPDAHSTEGIADVAYGVGAARKGWFTKNEVFNARTAAAVRKELDRRRKGR
jgi:DNA polymerase (family 10)